MNKSKKQKNVASKHSKLFRYGIVASVLTLLLLTAAAYYFIFKPNSSSVSPIVADNEIVKDEDISDDMPADEEPQVPTQPETATPSTPAPAPIAFKINKVHFSQAPATPWGAQFGQCTVGQEIQYTAVVDITATTAGTATYHWELADQHTGTVTTYEDTDLSFASTGTKQVERAFVYTAKDVGNGNNLWTRQYLNVFVTSPNENYANKDSEMFAYNNSNSVFFRWGTYIDLC